MLASMNRLFYVAWISILCLLSISGVSSEQPKVTTVRVIATEYYDEYQLPDNKKWQQVKSIRIEGQSSIGSVQVIETGPCDEMEAVLQNVVIPSEYWVTIVWQGGEQFRESYYSTPRRETVHRIGQPF